MPLEIRVQSLRQDFFHLASAPWVGSALGVLSLAAAIYFYIRSKRVRQISYQYSNTTLVGSSNATFPKAMQIFFGDNLVPMVTATKIIIWNSGTETIKGENIVGLDPLRFCVPEIGKVLQGIVVRETRKVILPSLQVFEDKVLIEFDFLDPSDGIILEIIHTAPKSPIELSGTIRGIPKGLSNLGRIDIYNSVNADLPIPFKNRKFVFYLALIIGCSMSIFGYFYSEFSRIFPTETEFDPGKVLLITGAIYTAIPLFGLWISRKRYPNALGFNSDEQQSKPDDDAFAPIRARSLNKPASSA